MRILVRLRKIKPESEKLNANVLDFMESLNSWEVRVEFWDLQIFKLRSPNFHGILRYPQLEGFLLQSLSGGGSYL